MILPLSRPPRRRAVGWTPSRDSGQPHAAIPDFRVEINYSPTPEIPLPLSLSGICPFTNLYTLSFQLLPSGGGLEPGSWKLPHPLLFYPWASRADSGSWKLPSFSHPPC